MNEPRRRPRRPSRRRRLVRTLVLLLAGGLLFLLGLGLGGALGDATPPEGEVTLVRTLEPLPLAPERETVTVTVTAP